MQISHHTYEFKFGLFQPHGYLKDHIKDENGKPIEGARESSCMIRRIRNGYMIECTDRDPSRRDRVHCEFFPEFGRETTDDRVYGCVVGVTANEGHFTSPILMVITRRGERERVLDGASNNAAIEAELAKSTWPIFLDLYPEGKSKRNEMTAKSILNCLKTGNFTEMPESATEPEVDRIVDVMISTQKELADQILGLILDVDTPIPARQYWACHFNSTSNRTTIQAFVEKKDQIVEFLRTKRDPYVMVQLLRALHRDPDSIPSAEFLRGIIQNEKFPRIVRGWAYALLHEHSPQASQGLLSDGEVAALGADLKSMIEGTNKRHAYIACTLAGYFPNMLQLEPVLEKCQEDALLFVRQAARFALLRAHELRAQRPTPSGKFLRWESPQE